MKPNFLQPYSAILQLSGVLLLVFTISRLVLVMAFWDRVSSQGHLAFIFLQGIRFDLIVLGLLFTIPALLTAIAAANRHTWRLAGYLLPPLLIILVLFAVFVESASLPFIQQFDARPNILFVEYLRYPQEVFGTLAAEYGPALVFSAAILVLAGRLSWQISRRAYRIPAPGRLRHTLAAIPLILLLSLVMIRSSNDHRPANPSLVAFSSDSLVNEFALNSPYFLLYALYEQRRDGGFGVQYGDVARETILSTIHDEMGYPGTAFPDPQTPTLHYQQAGTRRDRPLNLVIILEESLGAEFVGSLGGLPLTPELDRLAGQGIWFDRLYATGTRSVRGIEAVITGFTPTSSRSVVKLAKTQRNFFTVADLLREQGYSTSFIYGGEAHFDNMRRFFMANGFDTVIDEKDYEHPRYMGTWGASDEDLFQMADRVFSQQSEHPFFSLVFTSSNHEPFDIPAGKVPAQAGPNSDLHTAIRYADYALGQFFEQARQSDYWDDTVFVVVADHNSRVYGNALVPVERFHIPGLILGADIQPRHIAGVSSQIDLMPTVLSIMGVEAWHPMIGRDLSTGRYRDGSGRAIMQFNQVQAYLETQQQGDELLVFRANMPAKEFDYSANNGEFHPRAMNPDLLQRGLSYSGWGPLAISEGLYHGSDREIPLLVHHGPQALNP